MNKLKCNNFEKVAKKIKFLQEKGCWKYNILYTVFQLPAGRRVVADRQFFVWLCITCLNKNTFSYGLTTYFLGGGSPNAQKYKKTGMD